MFVNIVRSLSKSGALHSSLLFGGRGGEGDKEPCRVENRKWICYLNVQLIGNIVSFKGNKVL
jgi:hypothetical protein